MDPCRVSFMGDPWLFTASEDQRHAIGMDTHHLLNHPLPFTSKTITTQPLQRSDLSIERGHTQSCTTAECA